MAEPWVRKGSLARTPRGRRERVPVAAEEALVGARRQERELPAHGEKTQCEQSVNTIGPQAPISARRQ